MKSARRKRPALVGATAAPARRTARKRAFEVETPPNRDGAQRDGLRISASTVSRGDFSVKPPSIDRPLEATGVDAVRASA